jgi:periplasmic protein TonB
MANTGDRDKKPAPTEPTPLSSYTFPTSVLRNILGAKPSDGSGRGGELNPIPAKHGDLLPYSSIVLVKPSLRLTRESQVPVPPTLLDTNAAPILAPTPDIGLPWMQKDTNPAGPGKGHGIGSKDGNDLGDGGEGPAGYGTGNTPYGPGATLPACAYCPYPTYTDEARHAKEQGSVMLQVLVGADGRALNVRIIKGIGFGLDERAIQTVRGWRFIPARDGAKRPVAAWITVEAVFRLF